MEETLLSRRLVAVWFADIVGYSAHAAEDETGALRLVEILQTLSRETVRRYGGRVVKFLGDAVLAEFPSTDLALRAAVALNIEYADKSIASGGVHRLRIGVHVGDVAVGADGDLYGDAVNVAARHSRGRRTRSGGPEPRRLAAVEESPRIPVPVAGRSVLERHRFDDSIRCDPRGKRGETDAP